MDITVSVKCSDKVIHIDVNTLLKHDFFRTQLSNFNTKMTHETKTITDSRGNTQLIDCYCIPQISVGCKSDTLKKLLRSEYSDYTYYLSAGEYDDDIIEFFMYNDMYGFCYRISFGTWGFFVEEYFDLLLFVKQKVTHVNAYDFIKHFYFWSSYLEYSFKICPEGGLDKSLIPDLLEYLDDGLSQDYHFPYDNSITSNTIKTIIYCCKNGFLTEIKEILNVDKIKNTIDKFIKGNKFECMHKYNTLYEREKNMEIFKTIIREIFVLLGEISNYGIFDIRELQPVEKYIEYMENLPIYD